MNAQASSGPAPEANRAQRKVYLIDRDYQLREVNRAVAMFMSLILVQIVLFLGVAYLMRAGRLDEVTGPMVFVGVAFAVPMLLCVLYSWITLRQTHKVAGAAYRLERDIGHIVRDPSFRFRLRAGDYLQELARELNAVMEQVEAQQAEIQSALDTLDDLAETVDPLCRSLPDEAGESLRAHVEDLGHMLRQARFGEHAPNDESAAAS